MSKKGSSAVKAWYFGSVMIGFLTVVRLDVWESWLGGHLSNQMRLRLERRHDSCSRLGRFQHNFFWRPGSVRLAVSES
jgi:hypothetical protein